MADPQTPNARRALDGVSRIALLDTLRRNQKPLTVQQLADEVGLHGNTVRFHLSRLIQAGLVQEDSAGPSGPGRPKLVYSAVREEASESRNGYQLLAEILAGQLAAVSRSPSEEALAAGLEWGRHLTERPRPFASISPEKALERLVLLLEELGFEPEQDSPDSPLKLHSCPFRTVAAQQPDVACSVHLGLMRGALSEMGAPLAATALEPSFTSKPCRVKLEVTQRERSGRRSADRERDIAAE
ncbi:MAG TPA: helix-turn-helix domain-containing protein [Micromonosporaceae bacterium]|nr:helix-turn-helix domain-containing protein [Micromonosporaceae bacterium]